MASSLKTSTVYIEEISKNFTSVPKVETSLPAFIGYTQTAKNNKKNDLIGIPTKISSFLEYTTYFGGPEFETDFSITVNENANDERDIVVEGPSNKGRSNYLMYYAIRMYFANGGGPCFIVSVSKYLQNGELDVNDLKSGLDILKNETEPTLITFPDATSLPDAVTFYDLYNDALEQSAELQDRFVLIDTYTDDSDIEMNDSDDSNTNYGLRYRITSDEEKRKYGAVYFPYLKTVLNYQLDEENIKITHVLSGEVRTFGELNNKTLAAISEIDIALYNSIKSKCNKVKVVLPPSSSMAGIYTKVDNSRGIWRPPVNVFLNYVEKPTVKISSKLQKQLHIDSSGKSINAIRSLAGKGVTIQGAKTLLGNDPEWRYIPISRFFAMMDKSIKKSLAQFKTETNDAATWMEIQSMIESFLTNYWQAGALIGNSPKHAFYVKIGLNQTMTVQEVFNRIINIKIGLAIVNPKEFIVYKFSYKME